MQIKDVAAELGMPSTTCQSIEDRALKKCRAYLTEHGIAISDLIDDTMTPIELDTSGAESRLDNALDMEMIQ